MEVESHDWEEFESFHEKNCQNIKEIEENGIPSQLTDSLPKNSACVLLGVTDKHDDGLSNQPKEGLSSLNEDLRNVNADKLIDCCFPADQSFANKRSLFLSASFSKVFKRGFSLIENDRVWKKVVGNFGTLLPIDWQSSRAKKLQEKGLRLETRKDNKEQKNKNEEVANEEPPPESPQNTSQNGEVSRKTDLDDDDEEDEVQQAFDMHSLILSSNIQQEPLFTAEQVISEIEEMMMEDAIDAPLDDDDPGSFNLPPIIKKQNQNDEFHYETLPLRKPIIGGLV